MMDSRPIFRFVSREQNRFVFHEKFHFTPNGNHQFTRIFESVCTHFFPWLKLRGRKKSRSVTDLISRFFSNLLIMESTNTTEASLILDLDTNPKSSQIYNSVMERKHNKSNKVGVKQCYIFAIYGETFYRSI